MPLGSDSTAGEIGQVCLDSLKVTLRSCPESLPAAPLKGIREENSGTGSPDDDDNVCGRLQWAWVLCHREGREKPPPQPTSAFHDSDFTVENISVTLEIEAEGRNA